MTRPHRLRDVFATAFLLGLATPALAHDCAAVANDAQRLLCYDAAFGRAPATAVPAGPVAAPAVNPTAAAQQSSIDRQLNREARAARTLTMQWDLNPADPQAPFELRTYKPMYVLVATHTDRINTQPSSPTNPLPGTIPLDATEAQFQISFKTKVWDHIFGDNGSLWLGYTQSSRWQLYSDEISRPFRETNYEPEAMLVFRTPFEIAGWQSRMAGIGINHQSNGRAAPLSRSWNRIIAQWGLEKGDTTLLVRPWWRISESITTDDNPGIQNYVGRGEIIAAQRYGEHVVSLQARHSLRGGDNSRGSLKLEWAIPLSGYLKAYLSVFSGYGESLIDYNHNQTMVGAGFSLVEWR